MAARTMTSFLLVMTLLAGCTGGKPAQKNDGNNPSPSSTIPVKAATLPAPPEPLVLQGTPSKQVSLLADAFERREEGRPSALLAAFKLAGVPVVDGNGPSLTTAKDRIGVPWSMVWTTATVADPNVRIPLSQVGMPFAADGIGLDTDAVSTALLSGLRSALAGDPASPGPAPIALLVNEESSRAGGADLANPATLPGGVLVSAPTFALLVSAGLTTAAGGPSIGNPTPPAPQPAASGCVEEADGQWALWFISKVLGGVPVVDRRGWEGPFIPVVERLQTPPYHPSDVPVDINALRQRLGKIANAAGFIAAALTALSTLLAFWTLSGDVSLKEGEPLKRTASTTSDGERKNLLVTIKADYGKLPPDVVRGINCLFALLGIIGNNSTMPVPGPFPGVTVTVAGGQGFGTPLSNRGAYVALPGGLKKDTEGDSTATFPVTGLAQPRDVPRDAPEVDRTFSIKVWAKGDPTNGHSLARMFLDSFLCGLAIQVLACVDALGDALKQMSWELGEWDLDLTDWGTDRPTFVVDAFTSSVSSRMDGAAGGKTFIMTRLKKSETPMLSTTDPRCDPSGYCSLSLNFAALKSTELSWHSSSPPCSEQYAHTSDPYDTGVGEVPLPPYPPQGPFSVLAGPPHSHVYIGSTDNKCGVYYLLASREPIQFESLTELEPALMFSGKPVTLDWQGNGEYASAFGGSSISVGWSQSITFHRVNSDGSPYSP